jgi:hypothetical protein
MSKTYRDRLKKIMEKEEGEYWESIRPNYVYPYTQSHRTRSPWFKWQRSKFKDYCKVVIFYNKNPMWWNHLFTERPNRRETHQLTQLLLKDPTLADCIIFPLAKKPNNYYW